MDSMIRRRFASLCEAAGYSEDVSENALALFDSLIFPTLTPPEQGVWQSEISDENAPIELSIAISGGKCEVRVLFEPQGQEATLASYRQAALEFHEKLEAEHGVDLTRFRLVEDIFAPPSMCGPFAVWSSVVFREDGSTQFKSYLNPQASGAPQASAVVEEALRRLGFSNAWSSVAKAGARRGPFLDELKYFALDLDAGPSSRVKVYARHYGASPEALEEAASVAKEYVPGEVLDFAHHMAAGKNHLRSRATFTCSAFVEEEPDRPKAVTLYIPVCAYARDDKEVRERIAGYLDRDDASRLKYERLIDHYTTRDLDSGVGLQSWAAIRRLGESRLTVYLSTESRSIYPPGAVPAAGEDRLDFQSPRDVADALRPYSLLTHPFVGRLREEKSTKAGLLLAATLDAGVLAPLPQWLATVASRIEDEELRAIVAGRLHLELGGGEYAEAHRATVAEVVELLLSSAEEHASLSEADAMTEKLRVQLARHFMSADPHEAFGAFLAREFTFAGIAGELAALVETSFDGDYVSGLVDRLHAIDETEVEASRVALRLMDRLPASFDDVQAVRRGVMGVHQALWSWFDGVYAATMRRAEMFQESMVVPRFRERRQLPIREAQ